VVGEVAVGPVFNSFVMRREQRAVVLFCAWGERGVSEGAGT